MLRQQLAQGAAPHQAGSSRLLGEPDEQKQVFPSLQRDPALLRGGGGGGERQRHTTAVPTVPSLLALSTYLALAQPHQRRDEVAVPP